MIDTATSLMQTILDKPDSAEALHAIQHMITLVVERRDTIAFNYLGTLLRQQMRPEFVSYGGSYFRQALQQSETQVTALQIALETSRQRHQETEREYLRLQTLQQLMTLRSMPQNAEDTAHRAALSLQNSVSLLREQIQERITSLAEQYPGIYTDGSKGTIS